MAETLSTIAEMQRCVQQWRLSGLKVGFVPTMGNLHAGHLRLIEVAQACTDRVVVSVFVNPMQFDAAEDFAKYPRTLSDDLQQLAHMGVDAVFTPDERSIYPHGVADSTYVEVPGLTDVLEGRFRPGHFRGVATVVAGLFNIVQPQVAVFGEKDYQQLLLIRRLVQELHFPIVIEAVETVREADGLALSSRNRRLSAQQRTQAGALPRVLRGIAEQVRAGDVGFDALEQQGRAELAQAGLAPEYVAVRDAATLSDPKPGAAVVVLGAARAGEVRLLDVWPV